MNAFPRLTQVDLTTWYFDPMSEQNSQTICLQRSLEDCAGYAVVHWRTGQIIEAKEAWMIGLTATISTTQENEYDDFMQSNSTSGVDE
ncbi:hypothetical protein HYN46_14605 [Aquirhabdus parva]|uniref:Uncharacterized protein n=2 Tax=Aquirhabdus parva TaxID=2283318 RepID=A0A345P9K3_9GAMM|nr:hypothetical protein HYN46_14605 [Aquirhabdus parva]